MMCFSIRWVKLLGRYGEGRLRHQGAELARRQCWRLPCMRCRHGTIYQYTFMIKKTVYIIFTVILYDLIYCIWTVVDEIEYTEPPPPPGEPTPPPAISPTEIDGKEVQFFCRYGCLDAKDVGNSELYTGCQENEEDEGELNCFCDHEDNCNQLTCSGEALRTLGPRTLIRTSGGTQEFLPTPSTAANESMESAAARWRLHWPYLIFVCLYSCFS